MNTLRLLLLVPLAWAPFCSAGSAPQQSSSGPAWRQSQQTNAADRFTYSQFTLAGTFLTPADNVAVSRPTFVVNCIPADESPRSKATFLTGNLVVGDALKTVYVEPEEIRGISYFPKVNVQYRTDDAKRAVDEQWSPRSDTTSVTIPKSALKRLLRAHSVAITTQDSRGRPVAMRFDMPDPTAVEQGCDVDKH